MEIPPGKMQDPGLASFSVLASEGRHRFAGRMVAEASGLRLLPPAPGIDEPYIDLRNYSISVILPYLQLVLYGLQNFPGKDDLFWIEPEEAAKIPLTPEERISALYIGLGQSSSYDWIWPILQYPSSPTEAARIVILLARDIDKLRLDDPKYEFDTLFKYLLEHSQNTYPALSLQAWEKIWRMLTHHPRTAETLDLDGVQVDVGDLDYQIDEEDVRLQTNFAAIFLRTGLPADSLFAPEYNLIAPQAAEILLAVVRDENLARSVIAGIRRSRSQQPRRLS